MIQPSSAIADHGCDARYYGGHELRVGRQGTELDFRAGGGDDCEFSEAPGDRDGYVSVHHDVSGRD